MIWQEILPSYQAFLSPESTANPNPKDQLTITQQNRTQKRLWGRGRGEKNLNCLGECQGDYGGGFSIETYLLYCSEEGEKEKGKRDRKVREKGRKKAREGERGRER